MRRNGTTGSRDKRAELPNQPSNTFVGGGSLTVRITHATGQLTSGGLESKLGFGYGYYEVRAKISGGWATFWMQSPGIDDGTGNPALYGTEMDIQEACCPGPVQHAVHWNGYGPAHQFVTHAIAKSIVANQQDFNVYGFEWTPDTYKFWVNGQLSWTFTTSVSHRSDERIRLTQETDGDYCGGECLYVVDYVRAYTSGGPAADAGIDGGGHDGGSAGSGGGRASAGSGGNAGSAGRGGSPGSAGDVANDAALPTAPSGTAGMGGQTGEALEEGSAPSAGCGCRQSTRTPVAPWAMGIVLLALALARRRSSCCVRPVVELAGRSLTSL